MVKANTVTRVAKLHFFEKGNIVHRFIFSVGPNADESKDALMLHNMYRAMHQAPLLTWNKEMAAKAQDWAAKLAREQRLIHENESATDYGENLAEVGSDDKALLRAIDAWYTEVGLYNFKEPKFSKDSGHFSQVKDIKMYDRVISDGICLPGAWSVITFCVLETRCR